MWKKTLIAIATLAALTAGANARPSHHNEVTAAIGGLITGVVLSELADDANINLHLAGRHGDSWSRYDSNYRDYNRNNRNYRGYDNYRHSKSGHYTWEKRRVWVSGHWDYARNRHGRTVKIWVKGHHETRRVKVWVENNRRHGGDRYDNRRGDRYDNRGGDRYDNRRGDRYCR